MCKVMKMCISRKRLLRVGRGYALRTRVLLTPKLICFFFPFKQAISLCSLCSNNLCSSPTWSLTATVRSCDFSVAGTQLPCKPDTRSPALFSEVSPAHIIHVIFLALQPVWLYFTAFQAFHWHCSLSSECLFPSILLLHQFTCAYFCTACSQNFFSGFSFLFLLISVFILATPWSILLSLIIWCLPFLILNCYPSCPIEQARESRQKAHREKLLPWCFWALPYSEETY